MLTDAEIAARTTRAVAAAATAGTELGLRVAEPRVLYDVFSVIVHLYPEPVVARVPTVLPPSYSTDPETQTAQQRCELAVAGWLADRGHPVVPPSPLVPREPVRRDGFSMTFWQFVEQVPGAEPDMERRMARTAQLHAALRDYDGELDFWAPFGTYIPEGLAELERLPDLICAADLQRAQREWAVIAPVMTSRTAFESAFPGVDLQPIHGDAPYHNMIATPDGELWSDFELVTLGAIESDLAMVGPAAVAAYDAAAASLGLRPTDERVLRVTEAAARLAMIAALAMAPALPMLVDSIAPMIEQWRAGPAVTGL
ncbi:aminoglycoside phosphotransferase family protein [Mycolicibacterium sp. GF69]|uniref:phosphotransferase family protein n=1 Tax=Mycolicibacterium sp. GF69 TaxID=2267251 RepID=UPI000DCBC437|nr:phosphotransferase [Mycolicibacterium sp. GF69]RAV15135.1 aminoglycoside phosphotransferase family protein [Mycolicibacterium sp. GF69]